MSIMQILRCIKIEDYIQTENAGITKGIGARSLFLSAVLLRRVLQIYFTHLSFVFLFPEIFPHFFIN